MPRNRSEKHDEFREGLLKFAHAAKEAEYNSKTPGGERMLNAWHRLPFECQDRVKSVSKNGLWRDMAHTIFRMYGVEDVPARTRLSE